MEPPIIVNNRGDAAIFRSRNAAEEYMEPADVLDDQYVAYDSRGRLLYIDVEGGRVWVRGGEINPSHADDLRGILIRYLTYMKMPTEWLDNATLQELVNKRLEYECSY